MSAKTTVGVAAIIAGGYLAWFGVTYWRSDVKWPSDPVKAVLTGKPLPDQSRSDPVEIQGAGTAIGSAAAGGVAAVGRSNASIAIDALKYDGAGYVFGGRADKPGNWDCSSFVSYVLGHDLGLPLPGGGRYGDPGYPPHTHGPVASSFKLYGAGVNRDQLAAGDLAVWNTHIAIVLDGSGRTIAARTRSTGVGLGTIEGTSRSIAEQPVFRRVAVGGTAPPSGVGNLP